MNGITRVNMNVSSDIQGENGVTEKAGNVNRVCAGNINLSDGGNGIVEQKRGFARKQAFRIIKEAYQSDKSVTDNIRSMEEEKSKKVMQLTDLQKNLNSISEQKEELMKEYGVSADSSEQKDLELLEKYQDYKNGAGYEQFTKEEIERLKQLQNTPMTEYQKRVLKINDEKDSFSVQADKLKNEIIALTQSVTDAHSELEKSQGMLKAENAAEGIFEASEDEIVSSLINQAKDNIDDEFEEVKEKAEEKAEEEEEVQERQESVQQKKQEKEEKIKQNMIENDMKLNQIEADAGVRKTVTLSVDAAQTQIQKILEENNMIDEDLKGIEIDLYSLI